MLLKKLARKDVTVIGGGLSGICAAIAAARNGSEVALVHDRPVLGGNASSEVRVSPLGATGGGNRYAEEMGIVGEIKLESHFKNANGNPYVWDSILLDFVKRENKLELFLNTAVYAVEISARKIVNVKALQLGAEIEYCFESSIFIDCTGDGTVGHLAGADQMRGKEGKREFNESFAPETRAECSMGSTICFEIKNAGKPVKYYPPGFAYSKEKIEQILKHGNKTIDVKMTGFDYWWLEYGGTLDTIHDSESIKLELQKLAYGIWDFVKNSGRFDAESLTLDWMESIPGKRESRRLVGEYVLTQNDLTGQTEFEDAVCYGGWSIDRHPDEGIYSKDAPSSHQWVSPYNIPLRVLYSRNIENLLFAGRNLSATHIALASTRTMNTCALEGQAAGTAAALAAKHEVLTKELVRAHLPDLQQALLRDDCTFFGGRNNDSLDKARSGKISSSGFRQFCFEDPGRKFTLDEDLVMLLPAIKSIESVELLIDCERDTEEIYEVFLASKLQNYRPEKRFASRTLSLARRAKGWERLQIYLSGNSGNVILKLHKNPSISLYSTRFPYTGGGAWFKEETNLPMAFYPCLRLEGSADALYHHENIISGYSRPFGLPHVWSSQSLDSGSQWIEIDLHETEDIHEVLLFFNPDFNKEYYSLRPLYWGEGADRMPAELVKAYRIISILKGKETTIFVEKENFQRRARHVFEGLHAQKLRVVVEETWGSPFAEIFEVRIY
jgi:hypothetical protein